MCKVVEITVNVVYSAERKVQGLTMDAIPADTSFDAAVQQLRVLRRLGVAGRAEMTFQLSNNMRQLVEAGVRHRHRDYDEQRVRLAVLRLMIGADMFRKVSGNWKIKI